MKDIKGKIIAISSFKGGVGKTTTLLNLAGIFDKLEKKVLLVDLDFIGGDLSLCLNTKNKKTIFNAIDDMSNNRFRDYKDYVEKITDNIDVVNSIKDPRQSSLIELRYIEMFLNHVSYKYDIILLDTPYGFRRNTITALDVSDKNIFILSNDIMDIKSTKTALAIMKDIGKENIMLVLNESIKKDNNYFKKFDIENIIKTKIDYVIPKKNYIKNITSYILEGKILTLNKKVKINRKVYEQIASNIIQEKEVR